MNEVYPTTGDIYLDAKAEIERKLESLNKAIEKANKLELEVYISNIDIVPPEAPTPGKEYKPEIKPKGRPRYKLNRICKEF
jgi:hypothetical protein